MYPCSHISESFLYFRQSKAEVFNHFFSTYFNYFYATYFNHFFPTYFNNFSSPLSDYPPSPPFRCPQMYCANLTRLHVFYGASFLVNLQAQTLSLIPCFKNTTSSISIPLSHIFNSHLSTGVLSCSGLM